MTRVKIEEFDSLSIKDLLSNSEVDGFKGRHVCSYPNVEDFDASEKLATGGLVTKPWYEHDETLIDDFLKYGVTPPSKEAVKLSGALRAKHGNSEGILDAIRKGIEDNLVDVVNHPPHYTRGNIEAIEVIDDFFKDNYYLGTIFKYLARAGYKDSELQDLKKAQWYINKYIELLEK